MSFKPVIGDALKEFDQETINLYAKKENDPRLSYILSTIPRRDRHNLPVTVSTDNNTFMHALQKKADNF